MISRFIATFKRLLKDTDYKYYRYLFSEFNIDSRLTGLIGPRGTGKTTLLLQYIKEKIEDKDECIYVSIDHIYFSQNSLLEFVYELYDDYGIRYFFFDEIHKYPDWNQELKNIYDAYPDIKIIFSGSSSIDLIKGSHDLSRRGVLFRIGGMSFREYLMFNEIAYIEPLSLEDILQNASKIEDIVLGIKRLKGHFGDYLGNGYYPFIFEDKKRYRQKLMRIIDKTVYEDIPNFYKLKTENLSYFRRILSYLATIPPGELNRNNIARHIGLDYKTIQHYLAILSDTGLVELIQENRSGSTILKSTEKIYLENADLYSSIIEEIGHESKKGTLREIFFINMLKNAGHKVYYDKTADFEVDNMLFEIGGKSKKLRQIRERLDTAYLVKDDILTGSRYEIPLYMFGFLY